MWLGNAAIGSGGSGIDFSRTLHSQRLVGTPMLEVLDEMIELGLLLKNVLAGKANAFDTDAQTATRPKAWRCRPIGEPVRRVRRHLVSLQQSLRSEILARQMEFLPLNFLVTRWQRIERAFNAKAGRGLAHPCARDGGGNESRTPYWRNGSGYNWLCDRAGGHSHLQGDGRPAHRQGG
jgi:hypothetical protein